jgi:hypothetical protein
LFKTLDNLDHPLDDDSRDVISANSLLGVQYDIEKSELRPTLRTGIGITTMNIQNKWDYISHRPYKALKRVLNGCGFHKPRDFKWDEFWQGLSRELDRVQCIVVGLNRINPYSPSTFLTAFYSETPISLSNTLNIIKEANSKRAKAVCVLLNSAIFLAQFFLLKEESTGRYMHIRFYDLYEMSLYPNDNNIEALAKVFDSFACQEFPPLREQLDVNFDNRYKNFWIEKRKQQLTLFHDMPINPSKIRLEFDQAVLRALGFDPDLEELHRVYATIVKEMIITRGLKRD